MKRELHQRVRLAGSSALLMAALLCAASPPARAQSDDYARAQFQQGVELSSQGRWSEAEELFRRSHAEVPRASTAYNLTLALLHLGRGREALDVLSELSTRYGPDHAYRDQLEALRAHALRLVARLTLSVLPEDASIEIDGRAVAGSGGTRLVIVDPGQHVIRASAPGYQASERVVTARAEEPLSERIELAAEPPALATLAPAPAPVPLATAQPAPRARPELEPEPSTSPWPAIAWIGTGGALLAAGGVAVVLTLNADAELNEVCPDLPDCPPDRRQRVELLHERRGDYASASDVLLIGGAAVASAGVIWWLLARGESEPSVTAAVTPGGAAISVRRWF